MGDIQEIQLHVRVPQQGPINPIKDATPKTNTGRHWQWWLMVAFNIFFLLAGQTVGTLLGRLYFDKGGNSKWMATLVQSVGFPILFLPFFLFHSPQTPPTTLPPRPPVAKIALLYIVIGLMVAGDNLMYSYGLLYLPVSTYSLICASQLAFNAVFSFFLNSQKFTALVFNSIVLLTFSAALLGIQSDSEDSSGLPKGKYPLGFILTVGASATYSLLLSLTQLTFQKVLKRETFSVVLEWQICTSIVATCTTVVGLFASGEWSSLKGGMEGYEKGKMSYVMTLAWTAISWQVSSIGVIGLILMVSSLFSNVISTLALPIVPIFAVIFFHDSMSGVKVMALLIAIWGFASYIYQNYLDESKAKKALESDDKEMHGVHV